MSILVAYLAVITTVWIHWDIAPTSRLMSWLFLMSVVLLIRFIASKKNVNNIKTHAQLANWRNLRVFVSVLYGAGWGSMLFLLDTEAFDFYFLYKLATLTGVVGVTVNTLSVLLPVYAGLVTPIFLMDILFTFTNTPYLKSNEKISLLSGIVIYLVLLMITSRKSSELTRVALEQHFEREEAQEEIHSLAFYDPLTGLPNRRLLTDRLQQALVSSARNELVGAILFIDLDNFKAINDTLGHVLGDALLQQVATRLSSCVREEDTVARIGGDEFVVMLEHLSADEPEAATQTKSVGMKILAALSQPYQIASHECHCTCSIGITLFNDRQQSTDELLKQADIAMYQAKKAGRNALRFFDTQMQEIVTARATLEGELRKALEKQKFQLYYQIQVDSFQQPIGAEALIRWNHSDRGLVLPAQFIALAEETGLILPIGLWVLETACAQLKVWEQGEFTRGLILTVNVSAREFRQADFVAQVLATVQRHAIDPKRLKLELTESLLLENIKGTAVIMNALNDIGIQFSLDDFGTGYSSLQYLKRLPFDQIKIDQSFVRDLAVDGNDRAIVRTIIAMARSLNLDVIAEGVETEEQLQILLNKGCTHYQGYLFSKPMPIEQLDTQFKRAMKISLSAKN